MIWICVALWALLPVAFWAGRVYENHKCIRKMMAQGAVFKDKRADKL